jgi:phospho-N-acetylmuramoyl-pentapeptide-transferase
MLTTLLINHGFGFFTSEWIQTAAAFLLSFLFMLAFGRPFINLMRGWQKNGQPISENVPQSHLLKAGTPTMGGILILTAIFISSILFMDFASLPGWIALGALAWFGAIGFADDYKKVRAQKKSADNGLSPRLRLILEGVGVLAITYLAGLTFPAYIPAYSLVMPFGIIWPMGFILYFIFAYFVITGSANATNITDGLDGLLSKVYLPVLIVLIVALYGATRIGFADAIVFLPETVGLYPVLGAVLGAVLGFLWYNGAPASIFMGDVGSLALGGFMGTVAMLLKSEIIMGIAAGMMVLILLSSFLQTMFFKATRKITGTGRRIFRRAPLHHHFEELGWPESKIVERFFILSILFSGIALVLLKMV